MVQIIFWRRRRWILIMAEHFLMFNLSFFCKDLGHLSKRLGGVAQIIIVVVIFCHKWLNSWSSPQAKLGSRGCVNVDNARHRKERHKRFYVETLTWDKSRGGENSIIILRLQELHESLGCFREGDGWRSRRSPLVQKFGSLFLRE